jgi:membrane protease YdiL (CAAX protease family)
VSADLPSSSGQARPTSEPPGAVVAEVVLLTTAVLVAIRALRAVGSGVLWDLPLALIPVLFVWGPVWTLRARGQDPDRFPLALPEEREPWVTGARLSLSVTLALAAPFVAVYHLWQTALLPEALTWGCELGVRAACAEARRAAHFGPMWRFPDEPVRLVLYHALFVALPEELFYRGYMQSRLDEIWRPRWRIAGAWLGPGWLVTCLLFAVGHSVVAFQWWHLAITVPSLVFGWMRARTDHVLAGAMFHAICNIGVAFLDAAWGVSGA